MERLKAWLREWLGIPAIAERLAKQSENSAELKRNLLLALDVVGQQCKMIDAQKADLEAVIELMNGQQAEIDRLFALLQVETTKKVLKPRNWRETTAMMGNPS